MRAAPFIALGLAGIAREHSGAPAAQVLKPEHAAAVAAASPEMPCGAVRVDDEFAGDSFLSIWNIQRTALVAHFGGGVLPKGFAATPAMDKDCRKAWCDSWIAATEKASAASPAIRKDKDVAAQLVALKAVRSLVQLSGATSFRVERATARMAVVLDSAIALELNPEDLSAGAFFTDMKKTFQRGASKAAGGVGDALGFTVEGILAPVVGATLGASLAAIVSTAGPYLIVGGVAYYLHRSGKL